MPIPAPEAPPTKRLGPHEIVRLRPPMIEDPYSGEDTQADWDDPANPPEELARPGCSVQPGPAVALLREQREGVVIDYTIWAPVFDITERDRVAWQGETFVVEDTIQRWDFGAMAHLVIPVRRVEG